MSKNLTVGARVWVYTLSDCGGATAQTGYAPGTGSGMGKHFKQIAAGAVVLVWASGAHAAAACTAFGNTPRPVNKSISQV